MGTPLQVLAFFLLGALAVVAAKEGGGPRRPSWRLTATGSLRHTDVPGTLLRIVDADAGPLSIPNAALEPVGWGDLDGWTSDDHAVAFATFNASCRAIVRAVAFRAESATDHAADPRPVRAALEQVCSRAVKAGGIGFEAARQFFETNFVPVRIRKLGDPAGFVTVITIRSSMARDSRPGNSRCLYTVVLATSWRRESPKAGRHPTPDASSESHADRQARAVLRSRGDRGWGTRRSTPRNLLVAHRGGGAVDRDGGIRTCPPRGRLDAAHQL